MELIEAQRLLNANGFPAGAEDGVYGPRTRTALQHFQVATNHNTFKSGGLGPEEEQALARMDVSGRLSPHFTTREFRHSDDPCYMRAEHIDNLEIMREKLGRPIPIVSGFRTTRWNSHLPGSAKSSLHLYGLATDMESATVQVTLAEVRAMGLFSGVGVVRRTGWASHVDSRHMTGRHSQTPWDPALWYYPI